MLEKEQQYVDSLRSDLAKYADNNKVKELSNAERRVRKLQEQLQNLLNNQTQVSPFFWISNKCKL